MSHKTQKTQNEAIIIVPSGKLTFSEIEEVKKERREWLAVGFTVTIKTEGGTPVNIENLD